MDPLSALRLPITSYRLSFKMAFAQPLGLSMQDAPHGLADGLTEKRAQTMIHAPTSSFAPPTHLAMSSLPLPILALLEGVVLMKVATILHLGVFILAQRDSTGSTVIVHSFLF